MKNELIKVVSQHLNETTTTKAVTGFATQLQDKLNELFTFDTKVSVNEQNNKIVEVFYKEDTDDNSLTYKVLSITTSF